MSDWDYPFQNSYIENEDQWEEWEPNMHGVPDGVKRGIYGEFEVTPASSGLVVNVAGGVAVVRGFYTRRESVKPLTLQPPDTTNPRIDLVVLRRSKSGGGFTRMVITGDAAASPAAPAPVRDNDNWDLPLAEVYVAANAQNLDADDITDLRVWTSGLDEHLEDTNNPHGVTYSQTGAAAASHTHALGDLSDVDTTGASIGDALTLDATGKWVPGAGGTTYYLARALTGTATTTGYQSPTQMQDIFPPDNPVDWNPIELEDGDTGTGIAANTDAYFEATTTLLVDRIKITVNQAYVSGGQTVTHYLYGKLHEADSWTEIGTFTSSANHTVETEIVLTAPTSYRYFWLDLRAGGSNIYLREFQVSLAATLVFRGVPTGSKVQLYDSGATLLEEVQNDSWLTDAPVLAVTDVTDIATIKITRPDGSTAWLAFAAGDIEGGALVNGDVLTLYAR